MNNVFLRESEQARVQSTTDGNTDAQEITNERSETMVFVNTWKRHAQEKLRMNDWRHRRAGNYE